MVADALSNFNGVLYPTESFIRLNHNDTLENSSHATINLLGLENPDFLSNDREEAKVLIAMALSLLSGLFLVRI